MLYEVSTIARHATLLAQIVLEGRKWTNPAAELDRDSPHRCRRVQPDQPAPGDLLALRWYYEANLSLKAIEDGITRDSMTWLEFPIGSVDSCGGCCSADDRHPCICGAHDPLSHCVRVTSARRGSRAIPHGLRTAAIGLLHRQSHRVRGVVHGSAHGSARGGWGSTRLHLGDQRARDRRRALGSRMGKPRSPRLTLFLIRRTAPVARFGLRVHRAVPGDSQLTVRSGYTADALASARSDVEGVPHTCVRSEIAV